MKFIVKIFVSISTSVVFFLNQSLASNYDITIDGEILINNKELLIEDFDSIMNEKFPYIDICLSILENTKFNNQTKELIVEKMKKTKTLDYTSRLPAIFYKESYNASIRKDQNKRFLFQGAGNALSSIATRYSLSEIYIWASKEYIAKEDLPYIKKWFTTALENNPYETIIALRQIYKNNMYFHNKDAEKILKDIYQEAMDKY